MLLLRTTYFRPAMLAWCLFATACRKDREEPQWDVDLLGPLVTASLGVEDLIADSLLTTDQDGLITLIYRSELLSLPLDTLLELPDSTFSYPWVLPIPISFEVPPGVELFTLEEETRFDLDQVQLSEVLVRSGSLNASLSSEIQGATTLTFSLPNVLLEGQPFSVTRNVPARSGTSPSLVSVQSALDGYRFDLRGPQLQDVNTLAVLLTAATDESGGNTLLTPQDSVLASFTYADVVPQYVRGYFGQLTVDVPPETADLDLFRNMSGTLDLDRVAVRLRTENGVGADAQVRLDYLRALNTRTGQTVDLIADLVGGTIQITRAQDLGSGFSPSVNNVLLDQDNSNILALVENLPDQVEFAGEIMLNPLGNVSSGNDFLYYESRMGVDLEVELPLSLIATDLALQRTTTVDLPGTPEGHALQEAELMLFATNGFPLQAEILAEIVSADSTVLGTIAFDGPITSAVLGADGFVQSPTTCERRALVDKTLLDLLQSNGLLRITATFNTADQTQHVKILNSYRLDLQVTARANYVVNGNE
jgi:hypothetical protein